MGLQRYNKNTIDYIDGVFMFKIPVNEFFKFILDKIKAANEERKEKDPPIL